MANYRKIAQHYPAVRDYLTSQLWTRRRGVLTYRPDLRRPNFSTDSLGFRLSVFAGRPVAVDAVPEGEPVSAVIGSSHVFGFGLPGDQSTLPSRLADKLGHPVLNISLPEANTSDLLAVAAEVLDWKALHTVLLLPGGSFTRFCYSGRCSSTDGPPGIALHNSPLQGAADDEINALGRLVSYQAHFIAELAARCAQHGARFFTADEVTFFEKTSPSAAEQEAGLNAASAGPKLRTRFDRHIRHISAYREKLFPQIAAAGIAVLGFPAADELSFIDEFHYDSPSVTKLAENLFPQMQAL